MTEKQKNAIRKFDELIESKIVSVHVNFKENRKRSLDIYYDAKFDKNDVITIPYYSKYISKDNGYKKTAFTNDPLSLFSILSLEEDELSHFLIWKIIEKYDVNEFVNDFNSAYFYILDFRYPYDDGSKYSFPEHVNYMENNLFHLIPKEVQLLILLNNNKIKK